MRHCLGGAATLLGFALVGGCASTDDSAKDKATTAPHLLALTSYSASLGTPIDGIIANPPSGVVTKAELVFDGTFTHPDGRTENVSMSQEANRIEAGAVRWTSFGPFNNPFTSGEPDVGVYTGKVGIRFTSPDGTQTTDEEPLQVRFEVKPSIVITELQPTSASCGKPALRLIGAMPYKLRAKAIGFNATNIDYQFTVPSIIPDQDGKPAFDVDKDGKAQTTVTRFSHAMVGNEDAIDGKKDVLTLPPVPMDVPNYGVIMAVTAKDDQGHQVSTTFGMTAHRPLEVFYDGRFQLSQIYPAEPVSACIPGGQQGRSVDYSEAKTETRARTLSVTLSKSLVKTDENNWSTSDGKTVTHGTTTTDGYSKTHGTQNSFSFTQEHSDTSGVTFDWSNSHTDSNMDGWMEHGEGKVSFKPFGVGVELGGGAQHDHQAGHSDTSTTGGSRSNSTTNGWTKGETDTTLDQQTVDHSEATTDSTAVSTTNTKGGSASTQQGTGEADQDAWTVSSSDTIQRGFGGTVIANTYGAFYRQLARYTRRAFVLEYNMCGEGDVVGDLTLQDYVWAPDLALSDQCPPLPKTNFPEPQCFMSPCDP